MNAPKESYPLAWPHNWPRSKYPIPSPFGKTGAPLDLTKAVNAVYDELGRFKADNIIISTNLKVNLGGIARGQSMPKDTGAAVYFNLKNKPCVLACDKWLKIHENIWAVAKHVETLRGQERWGVGSVEQAFLGYMQLPDPNEKSWWEVLGVSPGESIENINTAYRNLAKALHSDKGGTHDAMVFLNKAFAQAKMAKGKA